MNVNLIQVLRDLHCLKAKKAAAALSAGQLLTSEISSGIAQAVSRLKVEQEKTDRSNAAQHQRLDNRFHRVNTLACQPEYSPGLRMRPCKHAALCEQAPVDSCN